MEELKTIQSLAPKDEDGRLHAVITCSGWYAHLSRHCEYKFPYFDNNLHFDFNHGVITGDARIGDHDTHYYKGHPLGIGNYRIATLWRLLPSEEERHDFLFKTFNGKYCLSQMLQFGEDDLKDALPNLWEIFTEEERAHPKLLKMFMDNLEMLKA